MNLTAVPGLLMGDPAFRETVECATQPFRAVVAPGAATAALAATMARRSAQNGGGPVVLVTPTGRQAEALAGEMRHYMPAREVEVLPSWETLPHERFSPRPDTVARRAAVLWRLKHPGREGDHDAPLRAVVVPLRALIQPIVKSLADVVPLSLRVGQAIGVEQVVGRLIELGYQRADLVVERGQVAVRGGIVDVFPPTAPHPVRIDFFGEEIEEILYFSAADQRSYEQGPASLWATACRELLLTEPMCERAASLAQTMPNYQNVLTAAAEGRHSEGIEALAGALGETMAPLVEMLPERSRVLLVDPERIRQRSMDLLNTSREFLTAAWSNAAAGGEAPVTVNATGFASLEDARSGALARGFGWWSVFLREQPDGDVATVRAQAGKRYFGNVDGAVEDMRAQLRDGWSVVLTAEGPGTGRRLLQSLRENELGAKIVEDLSEPPEPGQVSVVTATIDSGLLAAGLKFALYTSQDLLGRRGAAARAVKIPKRRARRTVDPLTLKAGDPVVHEQHGIGRFIELSSRKTGPGKDAPTREYLVIEYAPSKRGQAGDRLWVPTDSLDQVSRYTGGESPKLSKLGGREWAEAKTKARRAVREIASELVRLYAVRMQSKGHAFGPDTVWQKELEEAFPYNETPDQLATINEVKADMEKSTPMDRLISGDVGFGKTEIAVRAAFKAVLEGKQVAVLVPTTLLVSQHAETFRDRFSGFPVRVEALSRFQTDAEADQIRRDVLAGKVDVLIGTHRILTGAVHFKDLGLVIIDEEQRFGVEHKETLKQMRLDVDVLAMSATPIPRTLEMAMTGIREMSTLATPPEDRYPILTFVGPYEENQIAAAIRRELLREGQVFFLHNKVKSIHATAAHLQELVPEARFAVAHGRMGEKQLEKVISDFWYREYDVLVCTTIVETGLDIANANTLIVEDAQHMGLSQLHQLRGRVGRSRERAYAYFTYPGTETITETGQARLETIAANTQLGSGIAVAMKDLEIRGAGNLLGGEQSGHISGVGFDLYVRMVSEAVAALRGGTEMPRADVRIEIPVDAVVPGNYVDHESLRLEIYAKISGLNDDGEALALREELIDRYGPLPAQVECLFEVAATRTFARGLGIESIVAQGKNVAIGPATLPPSKEARLRRMYPGSVIRGAMRQILVPIPGGRQLGGKQIENTELLQWLRNLLEAIFEAPKTGETREI